MNEEKCKFAVPEVQFLGHHVTAEGIRPLPKSHKAFHIDCIINHTKIIKGGIIFAALGLFLKLKMSSDISVLIKLFQGTLRPAPG